MTARAARGGHWKNVVIISGTVLRGRYTLRIAIGNGATGRRHVQRAWELICEAADR